MPRGPRGEKCPVDAISLAATMGIVRVPGGITSELVAEAIVALSESTALGDLAPVEGFSWVFYYVIIRCRETSQFFSNAIGLT